ncbi:hypothetical protein AVEN_137557-1 [Araneus ventricosus]|uniref:Uncharacterized protein n=1 Tax=Araneus ventricosus TaxID=182803 RepID=A0A4Y2U9D2_ARAVE|nr:hypothetical protein AVEN_137557-1 [Araneus ventricosus]
MPARHSVPPLQNEGSFAPARYSRPERYGRPRKSTTAPHHARTTQSSEQFASIINHNNARNVRHIWRMPRSQEMASSIKKRQRRTRSSWFVLAFNAHRPTPKTRFEAVMVKQNADIPLLYIMQNQYGINVSAPEINRPEKR